MTMHPLLERAVEAAGGLERWRRVREIRATVSSGGLAFLGRLRGPKHHLKVTASPTEPRAVFSSFPSAGHRGVFDHSGVRIETENGRVVQQRERPRERCIRDKVWDDLRRHDYAAEVFGGKPSAHYHDDVREYAGFRVATRRRVYAKTSDGTPRRWLTLIDAYLDRVGGLPGAHVTQSSAAEDTAFMDGLSRRANVLVLEPGCCAQPQRLEVVALDLLDVLD
jgi:hypothetical protein